MNNFAANINEAIKANGSYPVILTHTNERYNCKGKLVKVENDEQHPYRFTFISDNNGYRQNVAFGNEKLHPRIKLVD